jgi:uncharacterized protein YvpB
MSGSAGVRKRRGSADPAAAGKKRARVIIDAPFIDQREKFPTGCESVTAVMALNHAGVDISVEDFIDTCLAKGSMPHEENGSVVGANPRKAFVGDPYSPDDNGCYAPVIRAAAEKAAGDGYRIVDVSGKSLKELCARYIRAGRPVMLWATMYMRPTRRGDTWKDETDPSVPVTWRNSEHCLLLVGYDKRHYYFNDPLVGARVGYTKSAVKRAYKSMFKQALAVERS